MQQFKGDESEWVDWKFRFLSAVRSGSLAIRKVNLEALLGTNDHLEDSYECGKGNSHLMKNCSDKASAS